MNTVARQSSDQKHDSAPIVVGIDGSESSRHALEWAVREAETRGVGVRVISTYAIPTIAMAEPGFSYEPANIQELADYTRKVAATEVAKASKAHPGVKVEAEVVEGSAAQALLEASVGASMLVVGSRGHGGFVGLLLGSVSQQCVTHAHCPVVVVRPYARPEKAAG
ncbi:MAG: universal stress protein [Candidatus Dormiibacterota bacterium]|jgi:nucleotide-binding universal stress UspA family protein